MWRGLASGIWAEVMIWAKYPSQLASDTYNQTRDYFPSHATHPIHTVLLWSRATSRLDCGHTTDKPTPLQTCQYNYGGWKLSIWYFCTTLSSELQMMTILTERIRDALYCKIAINRQIAISHQFFICTVKPISNKSDLYKTSITSGRFSGPSHWKKLTKPVFDVKNRLTRK